MAKRKAVDLSDLAPAPAEERRSTAEPTATVFARVPLDLNERLHDLAHARRKATGKRVTVNELVVEALQKLVEPRTEAEVTVRMPAALLDDLRLVLQSTNKTDVS